MYKYIHKSSITKLRDLGIEGLADKIHKLKRIKFLPLLNPQPGKPELMIDYLIFVESLRSIFFILEPAHKLKIDQNKLQNCRSNILNLVNVL